MDTKKQIDSMDWYFNPDPAKEAEEDARDAVFVPKRKALLNDFRAGKMTEDECVAALIRLAKEMGYPGHANPQHDDFSTRCFVKAELRGGESKSAKKKKAKSAN